LRRNEQFAVAQSIVLDLLNPNEDEDVPMDAMARRRSDRPHGRILVAVFQKEGGRVDDRASYSPVIKPEHLARRAIDYLRQPSEKQVHQNQESQRLQYDVAERMRALGWKQMEIVDSDLGSSAAKLPLGGKIRASLASGAEVPAIKVDGHAIRASL
jgi:hypothetical protein